MHLGVSWMDGVNCVPLSPLSLTDDKSSELMATPEWKPHGVEQMKVELSQKCQGTGAAGQG